MPISICQEFLLNEEWLWTGEGEMFVPLTRREAIAEFAERLMKDMKIVFAKPAVKYINSADKPTKQRLKTAIEKLPLGDVKKLQSLQNDYRLRVGDLRVLFSISDDTITVKDILPRGQAYKRL